jgi:hypothetical protein
MLAQSHHKQKWCHDKWVTDETYYQAIKAQFLTVELLLGFNKGKMMNKAILTSGGSTLDHFTESNHSGFSDMKEDTTIPLAISKGMYGDTMILPQEDKKMHRPPACWVVDLANEIVEQLFMKRKAEAKEVDI